MLNETNLSFFDHENIMKKDMQGHWVEDVKLQKTSNEAIWQGMESDSRKYYKRVGREV